MHWKLFYLQLTKNIFLQCIQKFLKQDKYVQKRRSLANSFCVLINWESSYVTIKSTKMTKTKI